MSEQKSYIIAECELVKHADGDLVWIETEQDYLPEIVLDADLLEFLEHYSKKHPQRKSVRLHDRLYEQHRMVIRLHAVAGAYATYELAEGNRTEGEIVVEIPTLHVNQWKAAKNRCVRLALSTTSEPELAK